VEVRYLKRAVMEVIAPGEEPETAEPEAYADDDTEADGTDEPVDDVPSAEEGLAESHDQRDDLAKSDKN
jgi:hypothetical protein